MLNRILKTRAMGARLWAVSALLLALPQSLIAHELVTASSLGGPSHSYSAPKGTTVIPATSLSSLSTLVVPKGATVILDLGKASSVVDKLSSIINFGTISVISSNSGAASLTLDVKSLNNASGATITDGSAGSLQINALSLKNAGSISDGSTLDIGSYSSHGLVINNRGGDLSAVGGVLNISSAASLTIMGGSLDAGTINLSAPNGSITAQLNSISGLVNTNAAAAHIGVNGGTLSIGTTNSTGDPTYFNSSGNININGNIAVGEDLAILASGNITVSPTVSFIQVKNANAQGYAIALIAGAALSGSGATSVINATPPVSGQATSLVSLSGAASTTGGNVDLTGSTSLQISSATTCYSCNNSGILMAAFANGSNGGQVLLAPPSATGTGTVVTTSGNAGSSGNITLIAGGASSGNGIQTGTLNAGGATGTITLANAQPVSSNGLPITFATTGNITSGNQLIPSITPAGASTTITGDLTAKNAIAITAGSGVFTDSYVSATVPVSAGIASSALAPNGQRLYVPSPSTGNVLVINTATNLVVATIKTGGTQLSSALVSPSGALVYVSDPADNSIYVINTATNAVTSTIPNITDATSLAISANGTQLFASEPSANSLAVINTTTNKVSTVSTGPSSVPQAVALNKSNGLVYVADTGSDNVSIYNPATTALTQSALGFSPGGFGPCPCGTKIFVSDPADGDVRLFSTETNSLIPSPTIGVGTTPAGIGINPTGSTAYVANSGSATLTLVSTLTNLPYQTLSLASGTTPSSVTAGFIGNNPMQYVYDSTGNLIVVKTPALSAPFTNISAATGGINAYSGTTTIGASSGSGGIIVTSPGTLTSTGGSTPGPYQLATTGSLVINGPISGSIIDFHAITGSLTNNSIMSAIGTLLFIASPNIFNNGSLSASNAGADTALSLQAPSGVLNVSLGAGSSITAIAPGNTALITFNPAGGTVANIGGNGSISVPQISGGINVSGSAGQTVTANVAEITGTLGVLQPANSISVTTSTGDLFICGCISTNGGSVAINAAGGSLNIAGNLNTDAAAIGRPAGNISLKAYNNINDAGGDISANSVGATGGNISVSTSLGSVVLSSPTYSLSSTGNATAYFGVVSVSAPGGITLNGAVQAQTGINITSTRGDIDISAKLTTTAGSINIVGGGSNIDLNGANILAQSPTRSVAQVVIENTNTSSGSITIGSSTSIATGGLGGGNVYVVIGPPTIPPVGPIPAGVDYSTTPTPYGPFYFGTQGITVVNPTNVSMTSTSGARVIFNTGNLGPSAITIDASSGAVSVTADPVSQPVALETPETDNSEVIIDSDEGL